MSKLNPYPEKGDIWEVYAVTGIRRPILVVDIVFNKEYNSHVATLKHLTGTQHIFDVPVVSMRQGVDTWIKLA
jgi:hypothetical protein